MILMARITEAEVGIAVLNILASRPNGEATVEVLKTELPKYITLSADDQAASPTRTNEEIWEQQVRNLKSHEPTNGNIFHNGYVVVVKRGTWQITDAGRRHIAAAA
jgi:hypothetical protein